MATKADEEKHVDTEECKTCDQLENKVSTGSFRLGKSDLDTTNQIKEKIDDNIEVDVRRGFFAKRRNNAAEVRPQQPQRQKGTSLPKNQDCPSLSRPAFFSGHGQTTSNTKLLPRAVAIPYSRFRKERFYDWPPDPTVSRATPIILHLDNTENDDSLSASIPDRPVSDHEEDDILDSSLREHHKCTEKESSGIPEYIMF